MNLFGWNIERAKVERDKLGNWSYWLKSNAFTNDANFLQWSLENPVLFAVISAKAKLYCQAEITVVDIKTGEVIEGAPELAIIENPNYFQSKQDFLYQQSWFLSATGNNLIYQIRPFTKELPKAMYNLVPSDIDYKDVLKVKNFIATVSEINEYGKQKIKYTLDSKSWDIELRNIIPLYDIANGLESNTLLKSPSRIRAVAKNVQNIEENLKSSNINLKMSQKYLARNKNNFNGVAGQIREEDRQAIEETLRFKDLQATNGDIDVQHLVSDLKKLYLSETFSHDATVIINAFGFNKDAINYAFTGSTFENQNNGIIRVIQTEVQSSIDNTMNSLSSGLGLIEKGIKYNASFNHLPIMQELINSKLDTLGKLQTAVKTGIENGTITPESGKAMTDKLIKELGL